MAFGKAHRRGHILAEINITPLTDVFLVLLIIFMITTSAMVKPAADVNLPETAEEQQETEGVMVTMTPSKQIYVGERSALVILRDVSESSHGQQVGARQTARRESRPGPPRCRPSAAPRQSPGDPWSGRRIPARG